MMKTDKELFSLIRERLYTPVVGDILDTLGHHHQFLPPEIRPIKDDMKLAGYAMTVLVGDVYSLPEKPFGLMIEALDQLKEDEIYITGGGLKRSAYWGEIMTATAHVRGAAGAVINGWHRDTPQVLEQNWPVFSRGCWAQDSSVRTVVLDYRCTIKIGDVIINDGDFIFGDVDGVLIIPQTVAHEVIEKSLIKAAGEKTVRTAIEGGMSAADAFAKYGIL